MNRSERRKKGIKEKTKVYTLNEHQIKEMKLKIMREAADTAMPMAMGFSLLALRDEFNFGAKRLDRFIDKVKELNQYCEEGYFEIKDLLETVEKETGIKINFKE